MRAVIQRVSSASVTVAGRLVGEIGEGVMALVGAGTGDDEKDVDYIARKIAELRIFEDADGKMNRSLDETRGAVLLISQFTLYGDVRKGRRPSFLDAMEPAGAARLIDQVRDRLRARGLTVATGEFGAMMDVTLVNRGPVTILLDS
jgi:D-tyrosyl-tRNA(Tyr) deacylase